MQGARNNPRMNEDPVGPRHWVAGGPVGYEHGMRDGMGVRSQDRSVARAAPQPLWTEKPRDALIGPVTGCDKEERDMGWNGGSIAPSNSPVGLGNQSPWTGEPWANHGGPGHGKSGKCPELWDGREVSAGVRVDPEAPRSMA